jgi:hypothetical protein
MCLVLGPACSLILALFFALVLRLICLVQRLAGILACI